MKGVYVPNSVPDGWWKETCVKTHQPLACVAINNEFLWVNHAFERLTGYSLAELREKTWMDITAQEDVGGDSASVRDVLAGTTDSYQIAKRYRHKFGHYLPINLCVWRYPQTNDRPECFIVEVSPKMASQAELIDLKEDLIKRIESMAERFKNYEHPENHDRRKVGDRDSGVEINVGDQTNNSDRMMIVMAGALGVMSIVLIWIAYYVFSRDGQQSPPQPMPQRVIENR